MRREVVWFFTILYSTVLFAEDTELRLYRPLTETTSQPRVEMTEKKTGECWQQSQRIKREDAWRCIADGESYDPCFVQRFGSHSKAICLNSPWSTRGVEVMVATPLDNRQHEALDMSQTYPWAIELSSGEKCQSIESTESFDGLPVRYSCDRNTVLIGHVQRCNSRWKILQHSTGGITTVEIAKAWF